jgi:hypothetical protein
MATRSYHVVIIEEDQFYDKDVKVPAREGEEEVLNCLLGKDHIKIGNHNNKKALFHAHHAGPLTLKNPPHNKVAYNMLRPLGFVTIMPTRPYFYGKVVVTGPKGRSLTMNEIADLKARYRACIDGNNQF